MKQEDWLDSDCARVIVRNMALDWLCDNGRGGREWLCALSTGLDAWREISGAGPSLINLPSTEWIIGTSDGYARITPDSQDEEEYMDEPLVRLGMKQWEDAIAVVPGKDINGLIKAASEVSVAETITHVRDEDRRLDIPGHACLASIGLMGLAIMRVASPRQLAFAGGNLQDPWHGYLGIRT